MEAAVNHTLRLYDGDHREYLKSSLYECALQGISTDARYCTMSVTSYVTYFDKASEIWNGIALSGTMLPLFLEANTFVK
jgi:hypothetical protein